MAAVSEVERLKEEIRSAREESNERKETYKKMEQNSKETKSQHAALKARNHSLDCELKVC